MEGKIHFGSEDTEEYLANTTGQGYQARASLELKLRHADEPEEAALCLADEHMRNFHSPRNIEGVKAPQHGSFMRLTKKEYKRLEKLLK